jgi:hypothetical protein
MLKVLFLLAAGAGAAVWYLKAPVDVNSAGGDYASISAEEIINPVFGDSPPSSEEDFDVEKAIDEIFGGQETSTGGYAAASGTLGLPEVNPVGVWTYSEEIGDDASLMNKLVWSGTIILRENGEYVETTTTRAVPRGEGQTERLLTLRLVGYWAEAEDLDSLGCRIESVTIEKNVGVEPARAAAAAENLRGANPIEVHAGLAGDDYVHVDFRGRRYLKLTRKPEGGL